MGKIEARQAIDRLAQIGEEFVSLFNTDHLSVEIYKPFLKDKQSPHNRDEFYLIMAGEGKFVLEGEATHFSQGDFLYVPAWAEHHFAEFSDDFITWVFFVGPERAFRSE